MRIKVAYGAGFSEPSVLQVCAVIQVRLHWLPDSPVLFGGRRRFLRHHASHVLATGRKARQVVTKADASCCNTCPEYTMQDS